MNIEFKNEATRANLQENKTILKWRPFWNKVHVDHIRWPNKRRTMRTCGHPFSPNFKVRQACDPFLLSNESLALHISRKEIKLFNGPQSLLAGTVFEDFG